MIVSFITEITNSFDKVKQLLFRYEIVVHGQEHYSGLNLGAFPHTLEVDKLRHDIVIAKAILMK